MAVIFGFLEEDERSHLLLRLNKKSRNEVYPISTHNLFFSQKMYNYSNPKTIEFVEKTVIGKLKCINEITFDYIDPQNISELADIISNVITNKFAINKLTFSNTLKISNKNKNSKSDNDFSNIEELVLAINGTKWKIEQLWLHNNSDLIWSWILSFLNTSYITQLTFSNITLSFIDQLNKIIKGSNSLKSIELNSWKLSKKSNLIPFQGNLAKLFPQLTRFSIINTNIKDLLGECFIGKSFCILTLKFNHL